MASSNPAMGVLDRAASGELNFGGLGEVGSIENLVGLFDKNRAN